MSTMYETDPHRSEREKFKYNNNGKRTFSVIMNDIQTVSPGQKIIVRIPKLGENQVIIPGTMRLAFDLTLSSTGTNADLNRTIVKNIGRNIIKQIKIKLNGKEVFNLDECNTFYMWKDLWETTQTQLNSVYQGICNENILKLRIMADDKDASVLDDKLLANTFDNRFFIPLDFELLSEHGPFYPNGLNDVLTYELTFNDNGQVIKSTDTKASYAVSGLELECEILEEPGRHNTMMVYTNPELIYYLIEFHDLIDIF